MNHLYGLTGLRVRAFEIQNEDTTKVNEFLEEYDGNIVDIAAVPMALGMTKIIVTYKAVES